MSETPERSLSRAGGPASRTSSRRAPATRRGIAMVWVALTLLALIGFAGLALDTGYCALVAGQLRTAAEAGAIAGAQLLYTDPPNVVNAAVNVSGMNRAAGAPVQLTPSTDVILGTYNTSTNTFVAGDPGNTTLATTVHRAVKVVARRTSASLGGPVGLFFGPVFGIPTADISRSAVAVLDWSIVPGLVVLNRTAPGALTVYGNGLTSLPGAAIQVNSSHPEALTAWGSPTVEADGIFVVGGCRIQGAANVSPTPATNCPPLEDPLASLPDPTFGAAQPGISLGNSEAQTIGPGYYRDGLSLGGNSTLVLNPGVYVLDGAGLQMSGGASIRGEGVTLFITGSGSVNIGSNNVVALAPPDPAVHAFPEAATYAGITIFQSRTNTNEGTIGGGGDSPMNGIIYYPAARMHISGNGSHLDITLIVDRLTISGSATLNINVNVARAPRAVYLAQ